MKATGVIRRIDELGRIVIPKEIRKTLRIKEGESLEIFIDGEEKIILKKYSALNSLLDFASKFTDSIYNACKCEAVITDTDTIIAASGSLKKKYLEKNISDHLLKSIKRRENLLEEYEKEIEIVDGSHESGTYALSTIMANGDAVGLVLLFSKDKEIGKEEMQIASITSAILGKYLEE